MNRGRVKSRIIRWVADRLSRGGGLGKESGKVKFKDNPVGGGEALKGKELGKELGKVEVKDNPVGGGEALNPVSMA